MQNVECDSTEEVDFEALVVLLKNLQKKLPGKSGFLRHFNVEDWKGVLRRESPHVEGPIALINNFVTEAEKEANGDLSGEVKMMIAAIREELAFLKRRLGLKIIWE